MYGLLEANSGLMKAWNTLNTSLFTSHGTSVINLISYELTLFSLLKGDFQSAGIDMVGYAAESFGSPVPVGLIIKAGLFGANQAKQYCGAL
ncbi:hypothetical protein CH379_012450 [Leptospira ellisii]|uniref:Uncharacterized protein n=1 Tax=Leptospira ellisii TaxID=2023197 RepID=A0AAE4TWK1_9LEPT|nr:hypothetical protein [Leptospira ellisii]MDV6236438.1 hypothetical protein [Leptospira ellisii]